MSKLYDENNENYDLHNELTALHTIHALKDSNPKLLKQIYESDSVDTGAVAKAVREHNISHLKRIGITAPGVRGAKGSRFQDANRQTSEVFAQMRLAKNNIDGGSKY